MMDVAVYWNPDNLIWSKCVIAYGFFLFIRKGTSGLNNVSLGTCLVRCLFMNRADPSKCCL